MEFSKIDAWLRLSSWSEASSWRNASFSISMVDIHSNFNFSWHEKNEAAWFTAGQETKRPASPFFVEKQFFRC
jgi:hypothetical protein